MNLAKQIWAFFYLKHYFLTVLVHSNTEEKGGDKS